MASVFSNDSPLQWIRIRGHYEEVLRVAFRIQYLSNQHLTNEKWQETDDEDLAEVVFWFSQNLQLTNATIARILEEEDASTIVMKSRYYKKGSVS